AAPDRRFFPESRTPPESAGFFFTLTDYERAGWYHFNCERECGGVGVVTFVGSALIKSPPEEWPPCRSRTVAIILGQCRARAALGCNSLGLNAKAERRLARVARRARRT
ncbi:unnamed protein product, partial [Amoebophrya sp. A120]